MEFAQEAIATLHDFGGGERLDPFDVVGSTDSRNTATGSTSPETTAPGSVSAGSVPDGARLAADAAVVVPMTERDVRTPTAERTLSELERADPAAVVVPVRAPGEAVPAVADWLDGFDLELTGLWCNAPAVQTLLEEVGLENGFGKGRDVWLALGVATDEGDAVVIHDADAKNYDATNVARLLAPLTLGYDFAKGYYARIENGQFYGRLCRLLYEPLVAALRSDDGNSMANNGSTTDGAVGGTVGAGTSGSCGTNGGAGASGAWEEKGDGAILEYLAAFRYALAGEIALSPELATSIRTPPAWGLEVATLGDAFDHAGFAGSAQVDLGRHVHDHRPVDGNGGLADMSRAVAATVCRVVEERGIEPDYETLADRVREHGYAKVTQYRADAAFNELVYDAAAEREQVERYARAIEPPGPDPRLPAWRDAPVDPADVLVAARIEQV